MPRTPTADIDVVILCGGLGTRLRPVVSDRPKPMADVGGRPFLAFLVDWVAGQGFKRFLLSVGYQAEMIESHFRGYRGLEVRFARESKPLGTGGAIKLAAAQGLSDPFFVFNGDSYCDVSLAGMLRFHARRKAVATVAAVPAGERTDGGFLSLDRAGRIKAFQEKSRAAGLAYINAGVLALGHGVLDMIPPGRAVSLEKEIFPELVGGKFFAYRAAGNLYDIGTPERLAVFREVLCQSQK